jgi:hypothetical protein
MSRQLIGSVILEYAMPLAAFLLLKLLAVGITGSNRKDSSERKGMRTEPVGAREDIYRSADW